MTRVLPIASAIALVISARCGCAQSRPTATPIIQPGDRTSSQSANTFQIAKDGKALAPIFIAADAPENIKATANYLAEKLEKISGAKFQVQTGDGKSGIVVGTISQFPIEDLKKPLETRRVLQSSEIENRPEAFAIQTEKNRVLLLGGGEAGASHAVARFLEVLGYRQFYPGAVWEVALSSPSLQWNRNETDRPAILVRAIWFAFGYPSEPYTSRTASWKPEERAGPARKDIESWQRQNRWGESFKVFAAHNWASIIRNHKAEFDAHPEYYSLAPDLVTKIVGRVPRSICVSNSAVRAFAVGDAIAYFEKNPDAAMYSLERGDGDVACQCENCRALGDESARVFGLANEAARALQGKHPGKMIGILAYNTHDLPPAFRMEPNVHVQVARIFMRSKTPYQDLMKQWRAKTANIGAREYFSTYQHGQDRLRVKASAGPTANLELLRNDISVFQNQGLLSVSSESSVAWGAHGRGNYMAAKLLWNPDTNVDELLQDFYDKAFGPAASAMKKYFERADGQNDAEPTPAFYLALMDDLDEAARLSKDRPDVLARLDQLKRFMIFNWIQYRALKGKSPQARQPYVLEQLCHEFRTRFEYMTHWEATRSLMGANRAIDKTWLLPTWKEYAEAKKEGRTISDPPWLDWNPYTREETETKFQEARKFFEAQSAAKP